MLELHFVHIVSSIEENCLILNYFLKMTCCKKLYTGNKPTKCLIYLEYYTYFGCIPALRI